MQLALLGHVQAREALHSRRNFKFHSDPAYHFKSHPSLAHHFQYLIQHIAQLHGGAHTQLTKHIAAMSFDCSFPDVVKLFA